MAGVGEVRCGVARQGGVEKGEVRGKARGGWFHDREIRCARGSERSHDWEWSSMTS